MCTLTRIVYDSTAATVLHFKGSSLGLVDGVAEGEEYNMFCYFGHVTPSQAVGISTNADICGERVSSYTLVVKWYLSANMYLLGSEMKLWFVREIIDIIVIRAVA